MGRNTAEIRSCAPGQWNLADPGARGTHAGRSGRLACQRGWRSGCRSDAVLQCDEGETTHHPSGHPCAASDDGHQRGSSTLRFGDRRSCRRFQHRRRGAFYTSTSPTARAGRRRERPIEVRELPAGTGDLRARYVCAHGFHLSCASGSPAGSAWGDLHTDRTAAARESALSVRRGSHALFRARIVGSSGEPGEDPVPGRAPPDAGGKPFYRSLTPLSPVSVALHGGRTCCCTRQPQHDTAGSAGV